MKYGILRTENNTGNDNEILTEFVAPMSVISNQPAYAQDMLNLTRNAASQNVQRWEIETGAMPSNNSSALLVHQCVNGHHAAIYARMPQVYGLSYTTKNITINGDTTYGGDLISINGNSTLVIGEFIQFKGFPKVYLVTQSGSAGVNIRIFPRLLDWIPDGTVILTGGKVTLKCLYDKDNVLGIKYVDGILSDPGSIRLIEKLEPSGYVPVIGG